MLAGSKPPRGIIACVLLVLLVAGLFRLRNHASLDMTSLPDTFKAYGSPSAPPPEPAPIDSAPPGVDSTSPAAAAPPPPQPPQVQQQQTLESFYSIALRHGTDKVTTHAYHHMYSKYLEPIRLQPLKVLEIGLGCDMNYGPGKSYYTWLEYLPNVDLYYMEYDAACANKWASKTTGATIVAGDQANVTFLNEFKDTYGRDFDVVIDDGGHTMVQQKTSLEHMFDAVKEGGVYFVEDLQTSFMAAYGGKDGGPDTMVGGVKTGVEDVILGDMRDRPGKGVWKEIWSVDCMREVCALGKKMSSEKY